jgi:hypothetical protein
MLNRIFKWISIISQSIGIGAIALYIYAYFSYRSNWEELSTAMRSNINLYLLIGIAGLLLYVITKVLMYFTARTPKEKAEQMTIDFDEEITDEIVTEKELESIVEEVLICPSCGNVLDKDAVVCPNCGILLQKKIVEEKKEHKRVVVAGKSVHIYQTIALMVIVIAGLFLAYDYSKDNGIFFVKEVSETEAKSNFYVLANSIITDVNTNYNDGDIKLNKNTVYFTLSDLGYTSYEYDTDKSYIAINATDKNIYISLLGINEYDGYNINITELEELDIRDVTDEYNVTDSDNKLLIGNDISSIIYYKN